MQNLISHIFSIVDDLSVDPRSITTSMSGISKAVMMVLGMVSSRWMNMMGISQIQDSTRPTTAVCVSSNAFTSLVNCNH